MPPTISSDDYLCSVQIELPLVLIPRNCAACFRMCSFNGHEIQFEKNRKTYWSVPKDMLGAARAGDRESRRRSDHPRGSHASTTDSSLARGSHNGPSASASDDFLERNVNENFLCESALFDGFVYMMRKTDHKAAAALREDLFPALAIALEATLRRAVDFQMTKESDAGTPQRSIASSKGKQLRKVAYFPEGPISTSESDTFHVIHVLAEELQKARRASRGQS